MNGLGLAGVIIVGGLAGWIANLLVKQRHGLLFNLAVGVIGSFIGAIAANRLGIDILPGLASSLLISAVGAVVLLSLLGLFRLRA